MNRLTIDELEMLNPTELGELLLYEVCKDSPDVQYIQDLLDVGCPIDIKNQFSYTAFHYAIGKQHFELAKYLLSKGADINARDNWGKTALHEITRWSWDIRMIKFLISNGADIHIRSYNDYTAWDTANLEIKVSLPELEPK